MKKKGRKRKARFGSVTVGLSLSDFCLKRSLNVLNLSLYILQSPRLFSPAAAERRAECAQRSAA